MKKHPFNLSVSVSALAVLVSALTVRADYSNSVMALKPAAYWPLNESASPPRVYLATNSGTLGSVANAYYNITHTRSNAVYTPVSFFTGPVPGVTSDGDAAAFFNGGTNNNDNSGYMLIPDINHSLDQGTTFSAEAWVKPGGGDPNDPTGKSYSSTEWTSIIAKGGGGWAYNVPADSAGNAYGWSIALAGIYTLGDPVGWYLPAPNTGPPNFLQTNACFVVDFYNGTSGNPSLEFMVPFREPTPQWYHLVLTFDGVNANFYTNGVLAATTVLGLPQSTNNVVAPNFSPITSPSGAYVLSSFVPDTINPLCIGNINPDGDLSNLGYPSSSSGTIGFNCQDYNGVIDEVALYTNALSAATVLKHYLDATNLNTTLYTNDVMSSNPIVYLRFDEPASVFVMPATNTLPVAASYGTVPGVAGLYEPGLIPGVPGPALPGFGSFTNAVACNGFNAAVDVGGGGHLQGTVLDPTNHQAFSVACWFKGNPADTFGRFQTILGRGDASWRFDMDQSGDIHFNPGNNPEVTSPVNYNDGNWHEAVGVSDGANVFLYIDGQLSVSASGAGSIAGASLDLLIGGAPDYTTGVHSEARYFAGQVTQVAFFTNALSSGQAEALYFDASSLAPVITQNPQNLDVSVTGSGSLSVISSGQPVTYQWYQGANPVSNVPGNISGATAATLTISNAVPANGGAYTVVVTNNFGSATSVVATVTVLSNVVVTTDITPTNVYLYPGGHATFSIVAGGTPPITYQWYSNSVAIAGATSTSYTLLNARTNAGFYCVASNATSGATSSTASVSILAATNPYPATVIGDNPVGFWRLNETNNPSLTFNTGATAYDYWGGNDGTYNIVDLGNPPYNPNEAGETSAGFGAHVFSNSMVFNISTNVNFSAPSNSSSVFSIECWVDGFAQTTDAGIISKGTGAGGEQFDLDTGNDITISNVTYHYFRFFVRDAQGNIHGASSTVAPDGKWHYLAAVCDEVHGFTTLYVDTLLVASNGFSSGLGIQASAQGMKIGARPPGPDPTANSDQFVGSMADVAVYNYPLSLTQIQNHYDAADVAPLIITQPTNTTAGELGNASFNVAAVGTAVPGYATGLGYQWFNGNTATAIPGATNSTLLLTSVSATLNNNQYYVVITNNFGTNQSQPATLTVISGVAQIVNDVQSPFFAILGGTGSDSVAAFGTEPLSYQWQANTGSGFANLTDGSGITGSQSNVLTIANAQLSQAGHYQVIVSNGSGSVTSSAALFIIGSSPIAFNVNGGGWTANNNAIIATNVLTLTEGAGGQSSSFFYNAPQFIGAFRASWIYQDVGGGGADGTTFCIQNDLRGVNALGGGGGQLGVFGITPSAELEFNIYGPNGVGYAFLTGGATGQGGGVYQTPGSINVGSGDPISVVLNYAGGVLNMTFTDTTNNARFSTAVGVNMPAVVGGQTAYVGFTGADGGVASVQTVSNFTFVSIPPQTIHVSSNNAVISWPSAVLGFTLQQNTNLSTTNWVTVTNADVIANSLHNVSVPIGAKNAFYRLFLP